MLLITLPAGVGADGGCSTGGAGGGAADPPHVAHVAGQAVSCPYWVEKYVQPGSFTLHHEHV